MAPLKLDLRPALGRLLTKEGSNIVLGGQRDMVRVPAYSRVDLRASKVFLLKKWNLTGHDTTESTAVAD